MYKAVLEEKRAEQLEYDECALMILCKLNNHQVGYDECVDDRPSIKTSKNCTCLCEARAVAKHEPSFTRASCTVVLLYSG